MTSMARYEMSGPGAEWVPRYPELVGKVTAADIQAVAKKLFLTDNMTWVVMGPEDKANEAVIDERQIIGTTRIARSLGTGLKA